MQKIFQLFRAVFQIVLTSMQFTDKYTIQRDWLGGHKMNTFENVLLITHS